MATVAFTFDASLGQATRDVERLTAELRQSKKELAEIAKTAGNSVTELEKVGRMQQHVAGLKDQLRAAKTNLSEVAGESRTAGGALQDLGGRLVAIAGPAAALAAGVRLFTGALADARQRSREAAEDLKQLADSMKAVIGASGGSATAGLLLKAESQAVAEATGIPLERARAIRGAAQTQGFGQGEAIAAAQLEQVSPGVTGEQLIDIADKLGVKPSGLANQLLEAQKLTSASPAETLGALGTIGESARAAGVDVTAALGLTAQAADANERKRAVSAVRAVMERIGSGVKGDKKRAGVTLRGLDPVAAMLEYATGAPEAFNAELEDPAFNFGVELVNRSARSDLTARLGAAAGGDNLRRAVGVRQGLAGATDDAERSRTRLRAAQEASGNSELFYAGRMKELDVQLQRAGYGAFSSFAARSAVESYRFVYGAEAGAFAADSLARDVAGHPSRDDPRSDVLPQAQYDALRKRAERETPWFTAKMVGEGVSFTNEGRDAAVERTLQVLIGEAKRGNALMEDQNAGLSGGGTLLDTRAQDREGHESWRYQESRSYGPGR